MNNVMNAKTFDGSRVNEAYDIDRDKVNQVDWSVSKQWAQRPADERFATLDDMFNRAKYFERNSRENPVNPTHIRVSDTMEIILPRKDGGQDITMAPTHLAFDQLCALGSPAIPAYFARNLPTHEAARLLRNCLTRTQVNEISAYMLDDTRNSLLRSCTYNEETRITIADIIRKLRPVVGNLTGMDGSDWKTPGKIDWSKYQHNPWDMKGQDSLFMSDRDMFIFFCQDANPIEIGKTRRGLPDVYFPGVIISASEVVTQGINITTMGLRGVCCNLSLRGVQNKKTLRINHTKNGRYRLDDAVEPVMSLAADMSTFARQIEEMKGSKIPLLTGSRTHDEREEGRLLFLTNRLGLGKKVSQEIMATSLRHEQTEIETLYDAHNAITQYAQRAKNYGDRVELEFTAMKLLPKAA